MAKAEQRTDHGDSPTSSPVPHRSPIHFPYQDPTVGPSAIYPTTLRNVLRNKEPPSTGSDLPSNISNRDSLVGYRRMQRSVDDTEMSERRRQKRPYTPSLPMRSHGLTSVYESLYDERENSGLEAFSDEYDLYPQIMQDVQRALTLKARREARLKLARPNSSLDESPGSSSAVSSMHRPTPSISPSVFVHLGVNSGSDVDFSPATGTTKGPETLHPVPRSSDDGRTLDWAGSSSDDERFEKRWSLISKRKSKAKAQNTGAVALRRQEDAYGAKLSRLKIIASQQTLRKARITSEQLRRRYNLLYDKLDADTERLNLAKICRWYGGLEMVVRSSLEKAEPLTWLKHLDKRRNANITRPRWHLSALIMEEYFQALCARPASSEHSPKFSLLESSVPGNPRSPATSPQSSQHSLGASRPKFHDVQLSFGPLRNLRNSSEVESRRSGESFYSNISGSSNPVMTSAVSPSSGFAQFNALRPHRQAGSEDGLSLSERSDAAQKPTSRPWSGTSNSSSNLVLRRNSNTKAPGSRDPPEAADSVHGMKEAKPGAIPPRNIPAFEAEQRSMDPNLSKKAASPSSRLNSHYTASLRLSADQDGVAKQQRLGEAEEQKIRQQYELKLKLLEETAAQNIRVRQILNRVAGTVREYQTLQSNLMRTLGIEYRGLPQEVLDAFGHDPAAVTGSTRRLRGWKAVEDIYTRILQQRDVLRQFLGHAAEREAPLGSDSVLERPLSTLLHSLDSLTARHREIVVKAKGVADILNKVKVLHTDVKLEYNEAASHTSVVYTELSYIIALEESYRDQYQQIWEFGMDTLTFLLDHVAPVWRTYGKTIGIDIQDFLIIPLYRNEFTGEAKRYSITAFPRRSLRHWLGLILFFLTTGVVCLLQGRAAVTSLVHWRLQTIIHSGIRWTVMPFFWVAIVIQWSAFTVECCIVLMLLAMTAWWIGWFIKLVD